MLREAAEFRRLVEALEGRGVPRLRLEPGALPLVIVALWDALGSPVLVVVPRPEDARGLFEALRFWCGEEPSLLHFPETEALPFERIASDADTVHRRLACLQGLLGRNAPLVVASTAALAQRTVDRRTFADAAHTLRVGDTVDPDELMGAWLRMGYRMEPTVHVPGAVGRRGGILDVFPPGAELPARIELWGDVIDGIRLFDPATQRSVKAAEEVTVIPAQETLPALTDREALDRLLAFVDLSNCGPSFRERLAQELDRLLDGHELEEVGYYAGLFNRGSLLDYFPRDGLVVMVRPREAARAAWEADERAERIRRAKEERGELPLRFPSPHIPWARLEEELEGLRRLEVQRWGADVEGPCLELPFSVPPGFMGDLEAFAEWVAEATEEGRRVVVVTAHSGRMAEVLSEAGVEAQVSEGLAGPPPPSSVTVVQSAAGGLERGFLLTADRGALAVLTDAEVLGTAKQRRPVRRRRARLEALLSELRPGDYVVHVEHGIARFLGTGKAGPGGQGEYLILQYAEGDRLYVPLDQLDRVSPYIAPSDRPPHLTRLGTQEWRRAKERAARSTRQMAAELLALYARRELARGHAFGPDTPWQRELEDSFPFQETPDQQEAIAMVKADMESPRPMDRLICGDVGYGKTEIALRAAFKAVMDGKQVALLVPTTVLAQQHYATFAQRLSPYPVTVEVLSRFRTPAEQKQVLEGLASGRVDICIGTHRLLQRDVAFKDLGLVIVDEEQRFGVAHKERLKHLRQEVDVLTLTATPIPRTLHMALAGVRDMSTIETPPEERLPIKTYVSEFSDDLVREAILRELDRQGQVYFLHNRIYDIEYMARYVRDLVPEARVGIAHGRLPEEELAETMSAFALGEIDVLVCTTIIESGLDIPNANTLIVDRADTFGLAQLYQLRGRIGRSARRAYAYLLVPADRPVTEAAERRLSAMLEASELGAGFRIAMRDLEIRGAGNILGPEQSGHINAVGFELYTRLLAQAVEDLRARGVDKMTAALEETAQEVVAAAEEQRQDVRVDLGVPAHLPEDYIPHLPTRLGIYQRLVRLQDPDQLEDMARELRDRFGPLPWQAQNLLYLLRLKLLARQAGIASIAREPRRIVLQFQDSVGGARRALARALGHHVEVGHAQLRLDLGRLSDGWQEPLMKTVAQVAELVQGWAQAGLTPSGRAT